VAARSLIPRLTDIIEAIERIRAVMGDIPLDVFEADWQRQWLVDRGVEIISEASRHLTDELKARHPEIPWEKVAGIGNVLRHNYERIAAPVIRYHTHDEHFLVTGAPTDDAAKYLFVRTR